MATGKRRRGVAVIILGVGMITVAPAAHAADPIMPLADVKPGMTGTAYTVISGTQIVTFPVTVLDVTRSGDGPGSSLIVIRAEGPLMDQTGGIAQGMSGSPVYVTGADGVRRVIGAIAYGQGDEKNVLGGITPIEQMLANVSGPRSLERSPATPRAGRRVIVAPTHDAAQAVRRRHPEALVLSPLIRWTASGLHPRLMGTLRRHLGSSVQVDSTGTAPLRPRVTLEPGSSMGAAVVSGPVAVGAIGTVTYVDGPTVLGFGHPFLGAGRESLILTDAHITTVVPAPIRGGSFKLGETGNVQGSVVGDRRDGLVARIGQTDAMSVNVESRDLGRGTESRLSVQLARQRELVPISADLVALESALRARDGGGRGTMTMDYTIETPGLPTIRYRNVFAAEGDVINLSSGRLGAIVATITDNPVRSLVPRAITVRQTLRPQVNAGTIVAARTATRTVKPGQRANLVLTVRMWQGKGRRIVVPFRVPRDLEPGVTKARIAPYDPTGFDSTQADLVAVLAGDSAPMRLHRFPSDGVVPMAATPARRVMRLVKKGTDDRHDAVRLLMPGENADDGDGREVGTDGLVISGGRAALTLRVGKRS